MSINKTVISDTADVTFKRKRDGHIVFTTEAQMASISQAVTEERLKGGIGNRDIALIRSAKEVSLAVRNALFDLEWLAMTQGVAVERDGKALVNKIETVTVGDAGAFTLSEVPAEGEVVFTNLDGVNKKVAADGTIPVDFAEQGERLKAIYKVEATGKLVEIAADKFSESYEVEYRTITYNPDTNAVVSDLYVQFDNVVPSGAVELSLENGTPLTPELNFNAMTEDNKIGRFFEVPRSTTP
ncbi:hypothetical protein SAMN05421503_1426 [Terribacillus aidingensis]|uniref:Uncharacterized protein n=1 Tax=Terribacillus aidingensis TaxID=586416 RepID=A0A285NKG6_9BACI|nr:hypothetical protein [Terribacillus aidingensis]SNZ09935.1 hypothetical protein SAMN05421503_1426 [Terribacillus aidingensis]